MSRSVPEWVATHSDQAIPQRVRLRVFEREGGRCWITGRKIMPGDKWQLDHRLALINGGEHREANLFPVLDAPHKDKTAADLGVKAKTARIRAKHLGIYPKSTRPIKSRGFAKRGEARS